MKKYLHGVIPAVLMTLAVGSIYAFSLFVAPIEEITGWGRISIQFAFSLGIFFLGMGAAFFGPLVERNIRLSSIIGTLMFVAGLCLTQVAVNCHMRWLLYLGYGAVVGTATGIIYISPVKTMMMWFRRNPGIASAVSIISFGFGASLCSFLYKYANAAYGSSGLFYCLAAIYFVMMIPGILLLKKPTTENRSKSERVNRIKLFLSDSYVRNAWSFMFLNISAGLAFIGCAASILKELGYSSGAIVLIVALMGVSNTLGRFLFAALSDVFKGNRAKTWMIISSLSIAVLIPATVFPSFMIVPLLVIPALYGGGFSTCPSVLSEHYGMSSISTIHGLVLSAWGFAGLVGNQISELSRIIFDGYFAIPIVLVFIHFFVLLVDCKILTGRN